MKIQFTFTHRGWFGICPVYLGGLDTEGPVVDPRHWTLTPLMMLSEAVYWVVFRCCEAMNPAFEASFPLRITGKLDPPIIHTSEAKDAN